MQSSYVRYARWCAIVVSFQYATVHIVVYCIPFGYLIERFNSAASVGLNWLSLASSIETIILYARH